MLSRRRRLARSATEPARAPTLQVWRPMAYAGAAAGVYANQAVRRERTGLAPMTP